jgi:hypothetical protein
VPCAVTLKRFLAPECDFILGMGRAIEADRVRREATTRGPLLRRAAAQAAARDRCSGG